MNQPTQVFQRYATLMPVAEKGALVVAPVPLSTLATSDEEAQQLATDANLLLIGRILTDGSVVPLNQGTP